MELLGRVQKFYQDVFRDTEDAKVISVTRADLDKIILAIRNNATFPTELKERDNNIILDYYGFLDLDREPYSRAELAKKYGVTHERVRQLIEKQIRKVRSHSDDLPILSLKAIDCMKQLAKLQKRMTMIQARLQSLAK